MAQHGIDAILRDRGEGRQESDPRRLPADPSQTAPSERRSTDTEEVDTPARGDRRVEPPVFGGAARGRDRDLAPFEITKSPVEVKAELDELGILGGLASLLG